MGARNSNLNASAPPAQMSTCSAFRITGIPSRRGCSRPPKAPAGQCRCLFSSILEGGRTATPGAKEILGGVQETANMPFCTLPVPAGGPRAFWRITPEVSMSSRQPFLFSKPGMTPHFMLGHTGVPLPSALSPATLSFVHSAPASPLP